MNSTNKKQDWHPADIKAALAKKNYKFSNLGLEHGYGRKSASMVLRKPWPQIEAIVSKIIGVRAADIWPSRYDRRGRPLKERTARVKTPVRRIAKQGIVSNG